MGDITLVDMRDEVKRHFRNRTDILDSRLNRIINIIQRRITRVMNWHEIKDIDYNNTSFTGDITLDKILDLPTNLKSIITLRLIDGTDSVKLTSKTIDLWDKLIPDPGRYRTDRPQFYVRWGNLIELWPVPNAVYTIDLRYTFWPADLSADADLSQLKHKDDLLIIGACNWIANSLGRMEDAVRFWRVYVKLLEDAVSEENDNPDKVLVPEYTTTKKLGAGTMNQYWLDPFVTENP